MKVKLRQLPNGKWHKFGTGKPSEASKEEIALWLAAQEDLAEGSGQRPSRFGKVADLAKWTALLLAAVTFFGLSADWAYHLNKFKELGIGDLAYQDFLSSPTHLAGGLRWAGVVSSAFLYMAMEYVLYRMLRHPQGSRARALERLGTVAVPGILVISVITWSAISETIPHLFLSYCYAAGAPIGLMLWLAAKEFIVDQPTRHTVQIAIGAMTALTVLLGATIFVPARAGEQVVQDILAGKASFAPVAVVVDRPLLMSNQVETRHGPGGANTYIGTLIRSPGGEDASSLQYVGSDDNAVYLLDIGAALVHAVPREAVLEVVFLIPSSSAWRASDFDMPQYWSTPTPFPALETPGP